MLKDRRLILIGLLGAAIAVNFWAGSRVPALNDKALMGGDTQLGAVGFETVVQVNPAHPKIVQAAYSTVNWIETNRKGMTFGVLFGAVLMTLIGLLKRKSFRNRFANSALGMGIGAPLGVCVNCAAPIAQGMHSAGARAETMLATMVSSPTLNVIVLTMLFALFPLYMVVIKLGLSVAVILVAIPLLTRFMMKDDAEPMSAPADEACEIPAAEPAPGWWDSFRWLVKNYLKSLWYVARTTVPLMFLAGFLGAVLVTYLPWESLATIVPDGSRVARLAGLGVVAAVGLFMPVPITFDIILPAILLAAGMPVGLVMVLLFTLGIFSVYAFFIVWKAIPKRVVLALTGVLLILGVGSGFGANRYSVTTEQRRERMIYAELAAGREASPSSIFHEGASTEGRDEQALVTTLVSSRSEASVLSNPPSGVSVGRLPFVAADRSGSPEFVKLEGGDIGLDAPYSYSILRFIEPSAFRGVATGDVHNDGWVDVLAPGPTGPALFANRGDGSFVRQPLTVEGLDRLLIVNGALVDLNDDGWLDLFLSSYDVGNFVVYNGGGTFSQSTLVPLPNQPDAMISAAAAFGDPDRDGDLDLALGNWSHDGIRGVPETNPESRNVLLRQGPDGFEVEELPGLPGGSLSALFTDFTGDGMLDLAIGNDFDVPDHFYVGGADGSLRLVTRAEGLIQRTGRSTMSFHSADLDNDLRQELYIGAISGRGGDTDLPMREMGLSECDDFTSPAALETCRSIMSVHAPITSSRRRLDAEACTTLDAAFRDDCLGIHLFEMAFRRRDPGLCDVYPEGWDRLDLICRLSAGSVRSGRLPPELAEDLPVQADDANILLVRTEEGQLVDEAEAFGIKVGGWTWNAKFADLDDDGLQDIYIANGTFAGAIREPNLLYMQESAGKFTDRTEDLGFASYMPASGYSYVDIDNDGDLDIILAPAVGPLLVYRNDFARGNAIEFELRDYVGNRFGIGSTIVIHYGPGGELHQMRELQAGGGFVSFDPVIAHFGLAEHDRVERVEITWSTGERTDLEGDFGAGARYVVTRDPASVTGPLVTSPSN